MTRSPSRWPKLARICAAFRGSVGMRHVNPNALDRPRRVCSGPAIRCPFGPPHPHDLVQRSLLSPPTTAPDDVIFELSP
jgi:hypothetical protein